MLISSSITSTSKSKQTRLFDYYVSMNIRGLCVPIAVHVCSAFAVTIQDALDPKYVTYTHSLHTKLAHFQFTIVSNRDRNY